MILTLTGPLAGKTMCLNGRQFVGGRLELRDDPRSCRLIAEYYVRCYEVEVDGEPKANKGPTGPEAVLFQAIAKVPRKEWVTDDGVAHPTVAAVAQRTGNFRLTKAEIIEVVKKWPLPS
jgi:hypothetical protein